METKTPRYVINWLLVDTNILVVGGHQQSKYVVAFDTNTQGMLLLMLLVDTNIQGEWYVDDVVAINPVDIKVCISAGEVCC